MMRRGWGLVMIDGHAKFNLKVIFFVQILGHCIRTHEVVNCFYKNCCLYTFIILEDWILMDQ